MNIKIVLCFLNKKIIELNLVNDFCVGFSFKKNVIDKSWEKKT